MMITQGKQCLVSTRLEGDLACRQATDLFRNEYSDCGLWRRRNAMVPCTLATARRDGPRGC